MQLHKFQQKIHGSKPCVQVSVVGTHEGDGLPRSIAEVNAMAAVLLQDFPGVATTESIRTAYCDKDPDHRFTRQIFVQCHLPLDTLVPEEYIEGSVRFQM